MNDAQPPTASRPESRPGRGLALQLWRWFWRVTLVVSLGYTWYALYVPSNDIAWVKDHDSAQQQAARTDKGVILFFTGKWCIPCRVMKRNVWADDQVAAAVNARYVLVTIDVGDPASASTVSRYGVGTTPATVVTDPQGNVLEQVTGGMGKADFLALLGRLESPGTPPTP